MDRFNDIRKQGAVKVMRDNYMDQVRNALRDLVRNKDEALYEERMGKANQDKIRSLLNLMVNKKT